MSCGDQWKAHWTCLENSNHEFSRCRKVEKPFNDCVFEQLVRVMTDRGPDTLQKLKKEVPGAKA